MSLTVILPIRTASEANLREHWARRAKRAREQRGLAALVCRAALALPSLPATITLTRIAPRRLDDDNLTRSFKAVRDGIADWLRVDDGSPLLTWRYSQEVGAPRTYAVRVDVRVEVLR